MSQELAVAGAAVGRNIHQIDVAINSADELIKQIPTLDDDVILDVYRYSSEVGRQAWRIECAVCASVVTREEKRGVKGVYVNEMASKLGINTIKLYRNAQVFALAESQKGLDVHTILPEKSFYEEAIRAKEPERALELIAAKRGDNVKYSARDARQDVQALNGTATGSDPDDEKQREITYISVPLDRDGMYNLGELCKLWKLDLKSALARCLMFVNQSDRKDVIDFTPLQTTPASTPARTGKKADAKPAAKSTPAGKATPAAKGKAEPKDKPLTRAQQAAKDRADKAAESAGVKAETPAADKPKRSHKKKTQDTGAAVAEQGLADFMSDVKDAEESVYPAGETASENTEPAAEHASEPVPLENNDAESGTNPDYQTEGQDADGDGIPDWITNEGENREG